MRKLFAIVPGVAVLLAAGCGELPTDGQWTVAAPSATDVGDCHATGVGSLTANYINTVPTAAFDVTCDIGIFFDQDGTIDGAIVNGTVAAARSVQYGIRVEGANVDVVNSTVLVADDYPHQFVSVGYRAGATGNVSANEISGGHRAGIIIADAGTSVTIKKNTVTGEGPTQSGWANNGIQISGGATATVTDNVIEDHWWNLDNFVSTGLLIYGSDNVTAQRNLVRNNDAGMYVVGSKNNTLHNVVEITYESTDIAGVYGIILVGDNNGIRQSEVASAVGSRGIGIYVVGKNNKLIRNTVTGWGINLYDVGDDTKLPKPFQQ